MDYTWIPVNLRKDLTGQRFGRLKVIRVLGKLDEGSTPIFFECLCDCGTLKPVRSDPLLRGKTVSCGCYANELASERFFKHGKKHTKVYAAYGAMVHRCKATKGKNYKWYGARGITVCDRWLESFENFYEDVGEPPSAEHSLDRIDNEKGYFPGNVRWATRHQQANNTRTNKFYTYKGEAKTVTQWARAKGIKEPTLARRLRHGYTIEQALETPVDTRLTGRPPKQ